MRTMRMRLKLLVEIRNFLKGRNSLAVLKFKARRNPALKPVTGRPSTPFRPRVSLLPRRTVRTGLDAVSLTDLENPIQETHGCSSSPKLGPVSFPSQATVSREAPVIQDLDVPTHSVGDLVGTASTDPRHEGISKNAQDCSPNLESSPQSSVQDGLQVHPYIYIGNVKLQSDFVDNIAGAFLQSSRKTLHFVPPIRQNGEIIIRPTKEVVDNGSKKWYSTAVGYFLGKRPYFPQLENFARPNWKGLQHVSASSSGFFFFRFHSRLAMEDVIEGGPWLFQGQPIVLQSWEQSMSLQRQKHTQIPVWIRLKHLSMEYWTDEGLSTVASSIGTPLYTDGITKDCSRLDFARVCVMLNFNSKLPKHLVVISPVLRNGKEDPKRIDVEYEWLPQRCKNCCSLGHVAATCPANIRRNIAPPISIFVKKQRPKLDSVRTGKNTQSKTAPKSAVNPVSTNSGCSVIKIISYNSAW
ncbi:hypothetical protein Sango_3075200 [Sesamum angolense]|uniref:DUF4283 domain-containing protein n=1 Tax=Sesamum angolense TaxID=2727404 RepID=A0AAE1W0H9_9LAMI|nr:hypothetical protein Sango_3075200 [Sesamum angolense]